MEVRNCAWTNVVDATMLTISSTTWTAKLERLMESLLGWKSAFRKRWLCFEMGSDQCLAKEGWLH
jgi:hypothetical protein